MTNGRRAVPFSPMRRAIARRMVDSKHAAPHFYVSTDVDMTSVLDGSARHNAALPQDEHVTVTAYLVRALATTLRRHPSFNAVWAGDELEVVDAVNIGVAITLDDGLIAPALLDCADQPLSELARRLRDLRDRARTGRLRPAEMSDATFTLSNLGMYPISAFTAIISPPQVAILATARTEQKPVIVDGKVASRPIMTATLSADHRAVDGSGAAAFLADLRGSLEASEVPPEAEVADLEGNIREASRRLNAVVTEVKSRRANLPLGYWRQAAHFTTPASDETIGRKAIEAGTAPMARILDRLGLTGLDLAQRLEIDRAPVEQLLAAPRRAPLVMLDGEDAQPLRDDLVSQGLQNAASLLANADWSGGGAGTLRFFRPPGFGLRTTVRDLYTVLWAVAKTSPPGRFALDGIVFPKVEHPDEVDLLYEILSRAEEALGLTPGAIRVAFLIESGWAVAQLPEIAVRAASRACALIFGLADYSADLGLPEISSDHPLAEWARAEIVAVAGGLGVPAIDAMTLEYPVADPSLDQSTNRERFLSRMRKVYDDAVRARELGMCGKWVGHPAQLFAVLLAFDAAFSAPTLEVEAAKLEAYTSSIREGRGAMIIDGVMSDRATDRHARTLIRRAVANGRFAPERAADLGVIDLAELDELTPGVDFTDAHHTESEGDNVAWAP